MKLGRELYREQIEKNEDVHVTCVLQMRKHTEKWLTKKAATRQEQRLDLKLHSSDK